MTKYVIVKHAAYWENYYIDDPNKGVLKSHSCHDTYIAKQLGIKPVYEDMCEAAHGAIKLNESNPSGNYAACPVIE